MTLEEYQAEQDRLELLLTSGNITEEQYFWEMTALDQEYLGEIDDYTVADEWCDARARWDDEYYDNDPW